MSISAFLEKHNNEETLSILELTEKWENQAIVDNLFSLNIGDGTRFEDLIVDGVLNPALAQAHGISSEAVSAFNELLKDKADTISEIRDLVLEKIELGQGSVDGLISKIQGQLGENLFKEATGGLAQLAESGSQEGWDVYFSEASGSPYIQVKIYNNPNEVIEKMREVNEKVLSGTVKGVNDELVEQIDFAVNEDIFDEVKEKVSELGLDNKLDSIPHTRDAIRGRLDNAVDAIGEPFEEFFKHLFIGVLSVTAIHAASNGYQLYRGAIDRSQFYEETIYSSAISSGGVAVGLAADALFFARLEMALGAMGGPVTAIGAIGLGMGTRAILKRFTNRRFLARELISGNASLNNYILKYAV
ncbi:MAG: hypothetical protein R3A80_07665 [Bdellovibrionota bacterium]